MDKHNEFFRVELEDGTVLEYGASPHDEAIHEEPDEDQRSFAKDSGQLRKYKLA